MSYALSCTSGLDNVLPFAGVMSERSDCFDVEFLTADGAKEMFAALLDASGSERNFPLFSRRMRQLSDSLFRRIAATRAYFASGFQTDLGASSLSRLAVDHLVTEFRDLFYFEFFAADVADQMFVTFSRASRLLNDFYEFVSECRNKGIFVRDNVLTVVKAEIHTVIPIIVIFDIAVFHTSCGDRLYLIHLTRSEIINCYGFDYGRAA